MATIKPGDSVWVKDIAALVEDDVVFVETGIDEHGCAIHTCYSVDGYAVRDHESLPAVAALLDEPGLAAALKKILSLTEVPWADEDGWVAKDLVKRFVSALEEGESHVNGDMLEVG